MVLSKSFIFRRISRGRYGYTDNRAGVTLNFFAYLISGRAEIVTRDRRISLKAGDAFFIPAGLAYESYWYGEPEIVFYSLAFRSLGTDDGRSYPLQRIECDHDAFELFRRVHEAGSSCAALSEFYRLADLLLPLMEGDVSDGAGRIFHTVADYIGAHPTERMSEVARACHISEPYLYLLFKREGGTTPNDYRQRRLCELGCELLANTDKTLEEISAQLGFSSGSYFRRVLKKHLSLTPREIRRRGAL